MSRPTITTARRRVSLMAGSSLVAAGLSAAASLSVVLAPGTASAQAICAPPPSSGGGTNSVTYSGTAYNAGIDCDANGDMTVAVTTNGVDIGSTGIVLTGDTESVTFNSTIEIDGVGLTGALLDIATTTGDIIVNAAALDADQSSATAMTHGLRAITAGGDIDITLTGTLDAEAGSSQTLGQSGIEARSTAGNGSVAITTASSVSGRVRGIYAQASGSGSLTINANNSVSTTTTVVLPNPSTTNVGQIAAIHAVAGSGLTTINIGGTFGSVDGRGASGVLAQTSGDIILDINAGRSVTGGFQTDTSGQGGGTPVDWVVELNTVAGRAITIDNAGTIQSVGISSSIYGHKAIQAAGGSLVLNNTGLIAGQVDFSGVSGGVEFNIAGTTATQGWWMTGESRMSSGSDALNIASGGFLNSALGSIGNPLPANAVIDFLAGNDAVNNDGLFRLRPSSIGGSVLTLQNLELFNNSGIIVLGTSTDSSRPPSASDRTADDVLLMPGTDFVGLTGSRIALDVELDSSGGQAACVTPTLVADCLGLAGGSTAGVTLLTVSDATATNRFAGYQTVPITLIDVNGGASAAGHFAIDPNSDGYDARHGGVLKAGHFFYALSYDDANQRHALYSIPDVELMEFTAVGQAIQGVWQTSTTGLFDRQAQARAGEEDAGIWLRASVERSDRDLIQTFTTGAGVGFDFDTGYEQETLSLTGGVDLLRSEGQHGGYSLGASLGYIDSRVEFPGTAAEISLEGGTLGLYGGYATGPLFVDATVNGLLLMMDIDDPAVGLPGPLPVREKVRGVGAQVEGGWRTEFGNLYVEPLLAASYVQTRFDQFSLAEVKLAFDEQTSLRAGAGLRVGGDAESVRFWMTGRYWNEFEGENTLLVDNDADDLTLADDFSGGFGELSGGASTTFTGGIVLFLNGGVKFADDYRAVNGSVGLSYRW